MRTPLQQGDQYNVVYVFTAVLAKVPVLVFLVMVVIISEGNV